MKIKSLMVFFSIIFLFNYGKAQVKLKGSMMVNVGLSKSDLYYKIYDLGLSHKNGPFYANKQEADFFFDFNITYIFKSNKYKIRPLIGFGYSPIGFKETGITLNDSQKYVPYILQVKLNFLNIFGGVSYTFLSNNKFNIKCSQTLNPMWSIDKPANHLRRIALCTKTNVTVDLKFKNGNVLAISPYFLTSITKFNKNKASPESPNYFPYCYGISFGTYFKK